MIRVIGMHTLVGCVALLAAVACASPAPTATPTATPARARCCAYAPCSGADDPDDSLYQGVK